MNKYQRHIKIFEKITGDDTVTVNLTRTQESNNYVVTDTDEVSGYIPTQLSVQVSGVMTEIAVSGKLDESHEEVPMMIMNKTTLEVVDKITEAGIYVIPCEEIQQLTFAVVGGNEVTATAKLIF